ncbi:hypothetical protein [Streptomyces sp. NPDC058872]|uniref:hypothetical protein n=1 Tax=Streptomyces sp. NPDC058872 TaxID=3346661 RepID=UPI00367F184C
MTDEMPEPGDAAVDEAVEETPGQPYEPAAAAPLGIVLEPTGRSGVDACLARLTEVDGLPADGHLEVYEDVHRALCAELTSLDAHTAPRPYENRS